jgi:hypothetical protein
MTQTNPFGSDPGGGPNPQKRYKLLGLTENPFAKSLLFIKLPYQLGEDENKRIENMLQATFVCVPDPEYARSLDNIECPFIYMAQPGGGKTASCRQVIEAIKDNNGYGAGDFPSLDHTEAPLVIVYDDFSQIDPIKEKCTNQSHFLPLLHAIARSAIEWLKMHPDPFLKADIVDQQWWLAFIASYSSQQIDYIPFAIGIKNCIQNSGSLSNPFSHDITLDAVLKDLLDHLTSIGLHRAFILVENLDGYGKVENWHTSLELINPLIQDRYLFDDPRLVWKFFLDARLQMNLEQYETVKSGLIGLVSLDMNEETLAQIINYRIIWSSNGFYQSLTKLCSDDLLETLESESRELGNNSQPVLLENHLAHLAVASGHSTPRQVLNMASDLFGGSSSTALTKQDYQSMIHKLREKHQEVNVSQPILLPSQERRIKDLKVTLDHYLDMLTDYQNHLPNVDNRQEIFRYQELIADLRKNIVEVEKEYREISSQVAPGLSRLEPIKQTLSLANNQISSLESRISNIEFEVDRLRLFIVDQFPIEQRPLLDQSVKQMSKEQLQTAINMMKAVEQARVTPHLAADQIKELQKIVQRSKDNQAISLKELFSKADLGGKLALKAAIPLVFPLLALEGEIYFEFVADLKAWFEKLKKLLADLLK